jgi:hypothetical protein
LVAFLYYNFIYLVIIIIIIIIWGDLADRYKMQYRNMEERTTEYASDFDGHDPIHRPRLRPTRGPNYDDSEHLDDNCLDATDALQDRARTEIILPIPFASRSCEACLQQKKGDYILLNLNAAMPHARSHHGVGVLYSCNTCGTTYKTKHAAQSHVPKCKGPSMGEGKNVV